MGNWDKLWEEVKRHAEWEKTLSDVKLKKRIDLVKKAYYSEVWQLTEANDLAALPGYAERGQHMHLDHIVPISYGYKNSIPPAVIADIKNLRFISKKQNFAKNCKVNEEVIKHLETLWN